MKSRQIKLQNSNVSSSFSQINSSLIGRWNLCVSVCVCALARVEAFTHVCVSFSHLQKLKCSQQFPGSVVPSVDLVVLQLWWEPRGAVVLVAHLDGGLRKRATYELCLALETPL